MGGGPFFVFCNIFILFCIKEGKGDVMSFFTCKDSSKVPGPICGSALNGLNERACILCHRVFDSGIVQRDSINETVTLTSQTPPAPVQPLTYVSGGSIGGNTVLQNLVITRIQDRPNFARVQGDAVVPVQINYTDANGVEGSGFSTITIPFDVVLFIPQDSLVPYEIQATARITLPIGSWVSGTTFNVTGCANLVIRVVVEAQILVPTYGYCLIPAATQFNDDVCRGFFDLPLYPSGLSTNNN